MELRPSQRAAADKIVHSPATLLVADMGWGKTRATVQALRELKLFGATPAVIVAPKRVACDEQTWQIEAPADLSIVLAHGSPAKRRQAIQAGADAVVTTWDSLHTAEIQAALANAQVQVLDEISYARSWGRRVRSLRKHSFVCSVGLTGTPSPRSLLDLFYPVQILDGGERWGRNMDTFKRQRFMPLDYNGYSWGPLPGAEEQIHRDLAALTFRGENIDLPPISVQRHELPFDSAEQQRVYGELERVCLATIDDDDILASTAAVAAGKLRQVSAGFVIESESGRVHWLSDARIEAAASLAEDAGKAVLTYEYVAQREKLLARLPGAITLDEPDAVSRWNNGEVDYLVMHPRSGGHGLNLQHSGCNQMIWLNTPWDLELWLQANARLARPGQKEAVVFVHVMSAPSKIERRVLELLEEKAEQQSRLIAAL